jgi:hypothetical protein
MTTFAGNWDPTKFQRFFSGSNPYEELRKQYPTSTGAAFDPSKLSKEAQEVYAIIQGGKAQDPSSSILTAQLQDIASQRASELSKQNIDYAIGQQRKYESERDKERFKYAMLASIPKTIAQSFANVSAMNLQGGQNVTDTFSRTLASYPRAQFNTPNIQYEKYFS